MRASRAADCARGKVHYNGEVVAFSTKGDKPVTVLYSHSQTAFITNLAIGGNSLVASSDVTCAVQVWKLPQ